VFWTFRVRICCCCCRCCWAVLLLRWAAAGLSCCWAELLLGWVASALSCFCVELFLRWAAAAVAGNELMLMLQHWCERSKKWRIWWWRSLMLMLQRWSKMLDWWWGSLMLTLSTIHYVDFESDVTPIVDWYMRSMIVESEYEWIQNLMLMFDDSNWWFWSLMLMWLQLMMSPIHDWSWDVSMRWPGCGHESMKRFPAGLRRDCSINYSIATMCRRIGQEIFCLICAKWTMDLPPSLEYSFRIEETIVGNPTITQITRLIDRVEGIW